MTFPFFKSHYSIGKSILTLADAKGNSQGSDSVFEIAQEEGLKELFLVEDSLIGFLEALRGCEKHDLNLRFGLRLTICDSLDEEQVQCEHKVIVFAKNAGGCQALNKIYSFAFTQGNGRIDCANLKKLWSAGDVSLVIPFYDSFIFQNLFYFAGCVPDFSFTKLTFCIENNNLPFEGLLTRKIVEYIEKTGGAPTLRAKSIYYKNREDFEAFQTYKCICRRQFSRKASLGNPNLEHCGSREFSVEAWRGEKEGS